MSTIPSGIDGILPNAPQPQPNGFTELSSEEFIRIMFTELENQDPFEPNDSGALLEQMNSIRSIESDIALTEQLESIVFENQLATAGNLIGRYVQGITSDGYAVDGLVSSVLRQGDRVSLELDTGWSLPMESISSIVDERLVQPIEPTASTGA